MEFNPYGGRAARVAVALVNTTETTAEALTAVVRSENMIVGDLDSGQADGVREWTARLRDVFAEPDKDVRVDLVNSLLADSACRPHIARHDGKPPHLHYSAENDSDPLRRIRAYTAGGLAHLICEEPGRMGRCEREGCHVVFVDTSRNGRRRYCSTRCATRVHVAQHRERGQS
ncbi:hypothetical protein BAY61_15480 [Prauserella marina]|uniref:CGNR zinc finger domain-containing protein n=1 Tax=Prauserella marina TaxID=530584 RepID=A0A222VR05_9PSEU|nr:CGNR zinc finger domain-containing protein [Prauserella marina]ASR36173.1 hypothetical protein BAY61_15480 [Prauserella marina]PWV76924.1 CGNR zinc finger protein [Prauserella marina]SDD00473.1 CGNR zinc finger domain-containing protein [Prauserella marina]